MNINQKHELQCEPKSLDHSSLVRHLPEEEDHTMLQNFTEAKGYKPLDIIGVKEVTEEENSVDQSQLKPYVF